MFGVCGASFRFTLFRLKLMRNNKQQMFQPIKLVQRTFYCFEDVTSPELQYDTCSGITASAACSCLHLLMCLQVKGQESPDQMLTSAPPTETRVCPGSPSHESPPQGDTSRWPNQLTWLLPVRKRSSSTQCCSRMSELMTLSPRPSPTTQDEHQQVLLFIRKTLSSPDGGRKHISGEHPSACSCFTAITCSLSFGRFPDSFHSMFWFNICHTHTSLLWKVQPVSTNIPAFSKWIKHNLEPLFCFPPSCLTADRYLVCSCLNRQTVEGTEFGSQQGEIETIW